MNKDMQQIREEIDNLDVRLLEILQQRAALSREIGHIKRQQNIETFNPGRERAILDRIAKLTRDPLTPAMAEAIFNVIFSISRSLQQINKIAYLGPEGSFSHQAALSIFPLDSQLIAQPTIDDIINEVNASRVEMGIVPVENSTEGMVNRTLDMMATSGLHVCREIMLPIHHCLLSTGLMEEIETVYSHPQPLAQCREWLRKNLPNARTEDTSSTSMGAIKSLQDRKSAAIASRNAARIYNLNIVAENINDDPHNTTRFWVISRSMQDVEGKAKTSIIITLENKPRALFNAIGAFAEEGINLTKIESRPSRKGPWEYIFFIDFQGKLDDVNVTAALERLKPYTTEIIILGSYPEEGNL